MDLKTRILSDIETRINSKIAILGKSVSLSPKNSWTIKNWKPHAGTQELVFNAIVSEDIDEIGYGGVRGTGKSDIGVMANVFEMFKYKEGYNGIYLRNKSSELSEIISRFKQGLVKEGLYHKKHWFWDGQLRILSLKNDAKIRFYHVENGGLDSLQGGNITHVTMEEPQQFKKIEEILGKVDALLRSSSNVNCKLIFLFNPLGPSNTFLKKYFVDNGSGNIIETEFGKKVFYFADKKDNPSIKPKYYKKLERLPEHMKRAWLYGDFNNQSGIAFPDLTIENNGFNVKNFQPDKHKWYMSLDWGYMQHSAVGFYCLYEDSVLIKFDELLFSQKTPVEAAWLIKNKMAEYNNSTFQFGVADTDIWSNDQGPSIADEMATVNLFWQKAFKNREAGFLRMHSVIKNKRFLAFNNLHYFWSSVPNLLYDETKPDIQQKPKQDDHVYDETRYMVMAIDFNQNTSKVKNTYN